MQPASDSIASPGKEPATAGAVQGARTRGTIPGGVRARTKGTMSAEGVRSGGNDSGYRRRMARGAAAGVLGLAAGRAASFVTVPVFLHLLGVRLYGVWVVATVLIGSQGLLDLGMATATVKHMAEAHELDSRRAARGILVTSFVVYAVLSAAFALLVAVLLPHIPGWLAVPPELGSRARVLLAGAIPCTRSRTSESSSVPLSRGCNGSDL